jgi:hypothetical protein
VPYSFSGPLLPSLNELVIILSDQQLNDYIKQSFSNLFIY